jgi:ribosomal protein L20A (L18A)
MQTYLVTYSGNATRFSNFQSTINADSEREAVEAVYQQIMAENYFPQDDGSIKDCDGHTIAEEDDDTIEYDGGSFSAEIMED